MIQTRILTPTLWPAVEKLFGASGACGGCWCWWWRVAKGEKWTDVKGATAKGRLRGGIRRSDVKGVLAFAGGEPVGWCTYGPRRSFAKLDRAPTLACDDADAVWSLPCFFVKAGWRGQGVGVALLAAACSAMKKEGARIVEGYPVQDKAGPQPAAFIYTGTRTLFAKAGFEPVGRRDRGKQRVRRKL